MSRQNPDFAAQGLFLEALSGEFKPPTDPLKRAHRLSRLALTAADKGRLYHEEGVGEEYPEGHVYTPSWANRSVAELWLPGDGEPFARQLIIGQQYGNNYPRQVSFTHEPTRRADVPKRGHLDVRDTSGSEVVYDISQLGPAMDRTRHEIAEQAQDFYNRLKPNK